MESRSVFIISIVFFVCIRLFLLPNGLCAQDAGGPTQTDTDPEPTTEPLTATPDLVGVSTQLSAATGANVSSPGNSGAAGANIPIEVPPGRNGIAPNLILSYSSSKGNGWLGVGWDMSLGDIQRSAKRGVNYADNDFVFSMGSGRSELVSRGDWGANYYGAKIESAFSKYFYNQSTGGWEVTTKDGTKYYYGSTSASRQDNVYGTFKWSLDKVQDINGNYMTVGYFKDQGEIHLDRIDYTGNVNGPGPTNYVKFWRDSGARADHKRRR